jgi:ankyrin repeat protein
VLALLRHGAGVNRTDDEGRTALIAAAYMGHSEIVEHLLDFGAEINHEDADGRTALSVAALCVPANEGYAKVCDFFCTQVDN